MFNLNYLLCLSRTKVVKLHLLQLSIMMHKVKQFFNKFTRYIIKKVQ